MDKTTFPRGIIFDKVLVNTYQKCISIMNYEEANVILGVDNIIQYKSDTGDKYIQMDPDEYTSPALPTFSESDKKILNKFYGEVTNIFYFFII